MTWRDTEVTGPQMAACRLADEAFLKPPGLTQRDPAEGIRVSSQRVNELVNGKRGITPVTALRLAKFFGTSPDVWLNLQLQWDLYRGMIEEAPILDQIEGLCAV